MIAAALCCSPCEPDKLNGCPNSVVAPVFDLTGQGRLRLYTCAYDLSKMEGF
jgi:hypothetical protein